MLSRDTGPLRAHAPRVIPPLSLMLPDLGSPTAAHLGAFLGVHPRTVRRWLAADAAPRPVMLALYWLTRWGRSAVEAQAVRDAALAHALLRAETTRAAQLAAALSALEAATSRRPQVISLDPAAAAPAARPAQG